MRILRIAVAAVSALGIVWQIVDLASWGSIPWPSALWLVAMLVAFAASVRLPSGTAAGVSATIVGSAALVCSAMWFRETPGALLALLMVPLALTLLLLAVSALSRSAKSSAPPAG